MTQGLVGTPMTRILFGHDYWRSERAANEIDEYVKLLGKLDDEMDNIVSTSGHNVLSRQQEVAIIPKMTAYAVISGYALEIGIKSVWALEHPNEKVQRTHKLLGFYDQLTPSTKKTLRDMRLTRGELENCPNPFEANRYSMETGTKELTLHDPKFLKSLSLLIRSKLPVLH